VRTGVRLVRAGEAIHDGVFTLYAGWAFSWTATPDGRRQVLDFHLPGDLVERTQDGAEVEAVTDASFCVLARDRLCEFMGRDPGLAMSYAEGLSRDRTRLRERLTSLGRRDAVGRVAHLLLELHARLLRRGGGDAKGGPMPLKQAHVADALGLSVEHANRALAQLRRDGLASLQKGRFDILDREGLEDIAGWVPAAPAPGPDGDRRRRGVGQGLPPRCAFALTCPACAACCLPFSCHCRRCRSWPRAIPPSTW
jgi:CRP-like cAMP-binding protein